MMPPERKQRVHNSDPDGRILLGDPNPLNPTAMKTPHNTTKNPGP